MKKFTINEKYFLKINNLSQADKWIIFWWLLDIALDNNININWLSSEWLNLFNKISMDLEIEKIKQNRVSMVRREVSWVLKSNVSNNVSSNVVFKPIETINPEPVINIVKEPVIDIIKEPEPTVFIEKQFSIVEKSKPMWELNLWNIHFPENKFDYSWEISDVELRYKNKVSYWDKVEDSFLGTIWILIQNEFERLKQYNWLKSDLIKSYTTDTLEDDKSRYRDETLVSYLKWDDVHCLDKTINFLEISIWEVMFYAKEYMDVLTDEVKNRTSILKYSLDKVIMYKNKSYYNSMNWYDNPVRLRSYYDWIKPYFVDVLNSTQVLSTACTINNPNFKTWAEELLPYFIDYQPVSTWVLRDWWNQDWVMEYYFDIAWLLFTEQLKHEDWEYSPLMLWEITFIDFLKNYYQKFFKINLYDNEYWYA